eukprot:1097482-Rhodomonas_salina.2
MEVSKAQEFAHTVPLHVLESDEAAVVKVANPPTVQPGSMRDHAARRDVCCAGSGVLHARQRRGAGAA